MSPPPLHAAILADNSTAIEQLLQDGCNINEYDSAGQTPLDLCFNTHNIGLFTLLLSKGADANRCANKRTIVYRAAVLDTEGPFLQALINSGIDINRPDTINYMRPIDFAIESKNLKAIELLEKAVQRNV